MAGPLETESDATCLIPGGRSSKIRRCYTFMAVFGELSLISGNNLFSSPCGLIVIYKTLTGCWV